mgnify:CR=1 FL=1
MNIDVKALSDSDLAQLYSQVVAETDRRQAIAVADQAVSEAMELVHNLHGVVHVQGAPYSQPLGAHDAYTLGNEVTHNGGLWRSRWAVNVWEPGTVDGAWERVGDAPDTEPGPLPLDDYPAWKPGIAVNAGDVYAHQGGLYSAIQAHTTQPDWAPDLVPAPWKKVG